MYKKKEIEIKKFNIKYLKYQFEGRKMKLNEIIYIYI